ncbi:unnamed protein product [Moneuplotes crassus]|uniref:histidine kinase n=1 Tax=Euplotes crassus TaxID=5936 RepID=A0AAD1Y9M2_EUPCR|nr:unnamed protein product [Moneuplotes crassus]
MHMLLKNNWIWKDIQDRWAFHDIDFGESKVEAIYQQQVLRTIRINWKFLLLIFKIIFFIIFVLFQFDNQDEPSIKRVIPLLLILLFFGLDYSIRRSKFIAKYGAVVIIVILGLFMTKVNLSLKKFRLYEGFLVHFSVSILLSTCVISDWKVPSIAVILIYLNLMIRLDMNFENVPPTLKIAIVFALFMFVFTAFLVYRTSKKEFLSTYKAKQVSAQLNKVLQGLPEGVIIMNDPGNKLKFINQKLKITLDLSIFQNCGKKIDRLAEMKQSIEDSFEKIYHKASGDSLSAQDSKDFIDNILSKLQVRIKSKRIEESKGNNPDVEKEEYMQLSLPTFLQDERELSMHEQFNERSTKVCITYDSSIFDEGTELVHRDFIVKTSKIDVIGGDEKSSTFLQMFIDTTQITLLEEARAQSNYQRQMLSNVSHEFRTPLNAMGLSLYLMKDHLSGELLKFHRIASSSCDILKTLVEDILDFSKIEAGVFQIEQSEFTFKELFDEIKDIFEMQVQTKPVSLNFKMDNIFQNQKIKTDKQRVKQILMNLVSNSVKFTDQGSIDVQLRIKPIRDGLCKKLSWNGCDLSKSIISEGLDDIFDEMPVLAINFCSNHYSFNTNPSKFDSDPCTLEKRRVFPRTVRIEEEEPIHPEFTRELKVEMTVSDTGIGIPEKDLSSLFKLFGKTSSDHNRNKTGTGLGLTICRKLCQKLGGNINLKSQEGVGTEVTCTFVCLY